MTEEIKKKLKTYRLSEAEYHQICDLLQREPRNVEWALFSALWSEHCSYKSSKIHLRKFGKTLNSTVVNGSGENAGVVDLGFGERIAFKMESHNHPSFIEPYQGAATGVGGILRDIFTMGARPIALADYLCFGEGSAPRMPALVDGVVRGISGYGNCVGVPTVTGQTNFHSAYNQNILVNAMAVGLLNPQDPIALSGAKGIGNWVVYVGAKTGKDGVHGAAMASESFDENSEAKKPNVQIGDPYFEKLLIESCLEVIQAGLVVSIQDMGAAGLTSSSFEMASKGGVGMEMHLDQVPLRDSSMTPEEILLSESQERMLLVCEPLKFESIQKHFSRWGLDAQKVGQVIAEKRVKLYWKGDLLTDVDPDLLVENAPVYNREFQAWAFPRRKTGAAVLMKGSELHQHLVGHLESIQGCSRKAIYRQYDQRVGARTAAGADECDVAIQKLPSGRGLAIAVGCRPEVMKIDAYLGALDAIAYPTLQMAVKGAKACAVTDCLNFGNPERPEIMSEFVASVDAITEISQKLQTPVISGNVSFYNETQGANIISTPATGLIGIRDSVEELAKDTFVASAQSVFCLKLKWAELNLKAQQFSGDLGLEKIQAFQSLLLGLEAAKLFSSSQMVGLAGLGVTVAKMCFSGFGFSSELSAQDLDWGGGAFYQAVFATSNPEQFEAFVRENSGSLVEFECREIGVTGGTDIQIGTDVRIPIEGMRSKSMSGLQDLIS
jgi:phosphoribosylformylglycinamidine synthase subunit PurL